jgi:predicted amidohydrolase
MRVLLTAMNCQKGAIGENLERHLQLLEEARQASCDLVAFPEFSLTGSVDPATHPERAIAIDDNAVTSLVDATASSGVAAVFGLAERSGSAFSITQVYASGGRILGHLRKRHLGEDEQGYAVGSDPGVFALGSARFGVVICAEGGVERLWADAAAAGAQVVLFCSAPGLYGRRTDEASWADGHRWWEECGLGDATRSARSHGFWVGMSTQAGTTEDEDFPGIAALVGPTGEIVERLPDWRAGTLVVEIPVEIVVSPVRRAVRVLILDEHNRTLLVRFAGEGGRSSWWVPPGGGLEPGEDHVAAARRELAEELDRTDLEIGPWIGSRTHTFWWQGWMTQQERWALCRTAAFEVPPTHVEALASENISGMRWWSAAELREAGVITGPRHLPSLLDRLAAGETLDPAGDLGV